MPERARLVTVTAPTRPGAGRDAPRATPWQAPAAAGGGQPGHDAGAGGGLGQVWVGHHPVTAEGLALLLCDLGLTGRPVLLVNQAGRAGSCPSLRPYATQLASLLSQPVLTFDGVTGTPRQAEASRGAV